MNNKSDNMFSENTFTFEDGKNGVTNRLMCQVYEYVVDRIEALKYPNAPAPNVCDTEINDLEAVSKPAAKSVKPTNVTAASFAPDNPDAPYWCGNCGHSGPYDGPCPACNSTMKLQYTRYRPFLHNRQGDHHLFHLQHRAARRPPHLLEIRGNLRKRAVTRNTLRDCLMQRGHHATCEV